jgi:NADH:quinone reductase (non-electrogenic)
MAKQRIVIVGGGFAGVKAALELGGDQRFAVTLISDRPDFEYHPSLYHTATGGVTAESSIPLQTILAGKPVTIMLDTATTLDRAQHIVSTTHGLHAEYDVLIVALGMVTNYFGIKGLEEFSYGMKSIAEVRELKAHIHKELTDDKAPDPNYVIVGGGPTGIELAGALPGYLRRVMQNHDIAPRPLSIDLIEAAPTLMPRLPAAVGQKIAKRLNKLGISLYLGKAVKGETATTLMVDDKPLATKTVIWTAGVTNNPFFKANSFKLTDKGKVEIDAYLQAEPNIYVLGDNANTEFSGMAQTALRDAKSVADNVRRALDKQPMVAYQPKKPVYVTPVGPHWAALYWHNFQLYGWAGSLMRSAANWVGYHDLEPWWPASKEWMTEFESQEECPTCAKAMTASE